MKIFITLSLAKIAQIIIQAIANLDLKEEKITDETDRQAGGFGSTGKF